MPLEIGREASLSALDEALVTDRRLVFCAQRDPMLDEPGSDDLYDVGTLAEIKQVVRLPGGTMKAVVEGVQRVTVRRFLAREPHFRVEVEAGLEEPAPEGNETEAMVLSIVHLYEEYLKLSRKGSGDAAFAMPSDNPGQLCDTIAAQVDIRSEDRQEILERFSVEERLTKLHEIMAHQIELLELERKIHARVRRQMEKSQKEYYLREQIKAIQRELGDREDQPDEAEEYRSKIEALELAKDTTDKLLREADRLARMPAAMAESAVLRTYLDWVCALPWQKETEDLLSIDKAEDVLNADHYGLEKVKERILEFLSVRQLAPELKGPILCLVGPPGVGKTSLGQSIARSLGRNFVRISLGGVRDEAEIRGHRRTYVGALPGRIIQGMRQAGTKNPVFLLDEIDKLAADFRGDPAAALLEVLDPEQNQNFSDHYIEIPFDLSGVMFITTANGLHNVPRPLIDRMETIFLPGYTENEKIGIAERHLVQKELKAHGLKPGDLEFSRSMLQTLVGSYTREAGVRNLQREIAACCRKAAREILAGKKPPVKVTRAWLEKHLGPPRFRHAKVQGQDQIGVATAVYYTDMGGDCMPIEVSVMPGSGHLLLTGKLGEVMRESAQAGFSYIRSRAESLGVDPGFHEHADIHIHVPEGATPKEGPSAGITMATALVSALSGRPVRCDVAMTGEITLRGRVLPIGGLKEKSLAAYRASMQTMIIPRDNEADLEELPGQVRRKLRFVLVEHMDEVLQTALREPEKASGDEV